MALELRLRPRAEADLSDIWEYTTAEWSMDQAERYLDGLAESFARLCDMPTLGREIAEVDPPIRMMVAGPHVIVYRTEADVLEVIRILGARQDWTRLLSVLD